MTPTIDSESLRTLVAALPRGRVTTYALLSDALGLELSDRDAVGRSLHPLCRETVMVLARGGAADARLLPCWRIVHEWESGVLSPLAGPSDHIAEGEPFYRIVIQPLLDDGLDVKPPLYAIDPSRLVHPRPR